MNLKLMILVVSALLSVASARASETVNSQEDVEDSAMVYHVSAPGAHVSGEVASSAIDFSGISGADVPQGAMTAWKELKNAEPSALSKDNVNSVVAKYGITPKQLLSAIVKSGDATPEDIADIAKHGGVRTADSDGKAIIIYIIIACLIGSFFG